MKNVLRLGCLWVVVLFSVSVFGQNLSQRQLIRKGNKAYEAGKFSEAEKEYRRAGEAGEPSGKAAYNLGNALYRQKRFEEAAGAYRSVADMKLSDAEKARVYHNLGNSLLEQKKYEESIEAYK